MKQTNKYPEDKFLERYEKENGEQEIFWRIDYHRRYSIRSLWLLFFTFSMGGWFWEVAYHWFSRGELVNRGALHGPWVPIYGVAVVLVLGLLYRLVDRPLLVFTFIMLLSAVVEYTTSYLLEEMMGIRFWDYSNDFLNLNGRIYLEGIIFFGLGGCMVLYLLAPMLEEVYKKLSERIKMTLLVILTFLFMIDVWFSYQYPNMANGVTFI